MVMKWLVPESSGRYVNRMTNEALHKGSKCSSWPGQLILPWDPGMLDVRTMAGVASGCGWRSGGEITGELSLGLLGSS